MIVIKYFLLLTYSRLGLAWENSVVTARNEEHCLQLSPHHRLLDLILFLWNNTLYNVTISLYLWSVNLSRFCRKGKVGKTNRKVEIYIEPISTSIFSIEIYRSFTEQQRNVIEYGFNAESKLTFFVKEQAIKLKLSSITLQGQFYLVSVSVKWYFNISIKQNHFVEN